ncbi:MAG: CE1759 family FMN reductase [Varibaculum sp.]|nr:CE1759 family FMN reductase [Varibaculum sp.]
MTEQIEHEDFTGTDPFTPVARHLAVVTAGMSESSQATALARELAEATAEGLSERGVVTEIHLIELRNLARAITDGVLTQVLTSELEAALTEVAAADGVVAVTPTYQASYSGLFKMFWDLIDVENNPLDGIPVLMGATGGSARHQLVTEYAMRPLFAYLHMEPTRRAVFAATEDWGEATADSVRDVPLQHRIAVAGADFAGVLLSRPARTRNATGADDQVSVVPFAELLHSL